MTNAPDLHVHSTFSTYDGLGSPKSVVARAVELGWGAVALTEHGWLGSATALYTEAKKAGIKPIIGCEMYVTPEDYLVDGDKTVLSERRHLTVLCLNFEGYQNLITWVNASMQRPSYYNGPRISLDRMADIAPHGLGNNVVLSGCLGGELCQCLAHNTPYSDIAAQMYLEAASTLFPNFYVEIQNHGHAKFIDRGFDNYDVMVREQDAVRNKLLDLAQGMDIPVIVTNDSHYQSQEQRKAHIAMLARKQYKRSKDAHEGATSASSADGFAAQYAYWTNYMRPMEKIADTLPSWAAKQSIQSIHEIVDEVDIVLHPLDKFTYTLPKSGYDDPVAEVRKRCKPRLKSMVARHGPQAAERFEYELGAMTEFADYLLIYSDIVRMARAQGIYTWTRGSAANSLVNYCLKIHEIDPIHYKLMFERFVNPARAKFPDVDIDIEAHRQGDVARMVIEHMAQIEGPGNVMPICTYSTVANRSAFKMMAEAAGVPKERIEELAKLLPQMIDSGMAQSDEEAYELLKEELGLDIHAEASAIFDAVGGVSQHACAFALGTRERPLSQWVPQYRIGSSDALVTQYNMDAIEKLGFLKLDLLRLDTLSILHNVARMLGKSLDWLDTIAQDVPGIYKLDEATLAMLRSGRTEGIHSMQGSTQRRGCIEVGVESVEDMVAVQALYRPSGTRTGNDKQYVNRKHGREEWESINEFVGSFLDESYGFAIYQEQIMEMGSAMGMTGAEIDDLYKAIKTAKGTGRGAEELFDAFEPTFRKYADKAMPKADADELWAMWHALQGYTFNRGHASSYAILAAKTAEVKERYPQEFFVALLERYPDNPRYIAAALAEGFSFEPPDVNTSAAGFTRGSTDKSIRVGLLRIRDVGPGAASEIVRNQPFASLEDLIERTHSGRVDKTVRENLRAIGALESLGIRGDEDDLTNFRLLNFVPSKPRVFKSIKPKLGSRRGGSWEFKGLQHGVDITEGKSFCAKLFWVPPDPAFATKSSAQGRYNAHLLTAVDENGIPFDITVSEDKVDEAKFIKYLARKGHDTVVCIEGQISMPFLAKGNTSFKFWGIVGAEAGNPLIWRGDEMLAKVAIQTAKDKASKRRR